MKRVSGEGVSEDMEAGDYRSECGMGNARMREMEGGTVSFRTSEARRNPLPLVQFALTGRGSLLAIRFRDRKGLAARRDDNRGNAQVVN